MAGWVLSAQVRQTPALSNAATLLGWSQEALITALTTRRIIAPGEVVIKLLKVLPHELYGLGITFPYNPRLPATIHPSCRHSKVQGPSIRSVTLCGKEAGSSNGGKESTTRSTALGALSNGRLRPMQSTKIRVRCIHNS